MKISRVRAVVASVVILATLGSFVAHVGFGSYSSFGFAGLSYACPVGILEGMLGAKSFDWTGLFCLAVVVVVALVAGKAFCSWICPTPWVRRIFGTGGSTKKKLSGATRASSCGYTCGNRIETCAACGKKPLEAIGGERDGRLIDGRHGVLAAALLSSFAFGFPVFCLVCPIGLVFATMLAVGYAFSQHIFVWDMVVFPLILALELVVFKSWCFKICPVSAFLSLLSRRRRFVRPRVDESACLRANGIDCHACVDLCPENVDPHSLDIPECTQCGLCADACPEKAIRLAKRP